AGLHESAVQALPSSQWSGGPPTQAPSVLHVSFLVQALPSSHGAPAVGVCTQPPGAPQASAVQGLPSSQPARGPLTPAAPGEQVSPVVQALPSLQGTPGVGVPAHPITVQPSPKQPSGGFTVPHRSLIVQALWSSQGAPGVS